VPHPSPSAVSPPTGSELQLLLATVSFAVCFAVFGSVSAMMPLLSAKLQLTSFQKGVALALPVLLGSLGRIPLGMLTDRLGGRSVFLASMVAALVPVTLLGWVESYEGLLVCGFFAGLALAVFPIGISLVGGWYPAHRQGLALGVYGMGNVGQGAAALAAPFLAQRLGPAWGFWSFSIMVLGWLVVFALLARNPPRQRRPQEWRDYLRPLRQPAGWVLSLYYSLTFGGFVALASCLPLYFVELFGLSPIEAGLRTALFIVVATACRPLGGWLADRLGGGTILMGVFPVIGCMGALLALPSLNCFLTGVLGIAVALGLGNGAVFKLVPQRFPDSVGSATGLVGAAGGLGGFFPPLVAGLLRHWTGRHSEAFLLLALYGVGCWLICWWEWRSSLQGTPSAESSL
jgi:NNP family nitrate/nitrite transporter-like MFS transporter